MYDASDAIEGIVSRKIVALERVSCHLSAACEGLVLVSAGFVTRRDIGGWLWNRQKR